MKAVKAITVCFKSRNSHGGFDGVDRKELVGNSSALSMVRKVVENEKTVDAGLSMDTIIVNNDTGYEKGFDYLESINNTRSKNGVFKIIHRPNIGISFGGFNEAFKRHKEEYDYWLFSEDDFCYHKDGYAQHYLGVLSENPNCAFVATLGIGRPTHATKHAHGGMGFTHRDYMEETIPLEYHEDDGNNKQAFKKAGSLPYYREKKDANETRPHCIYGEVPFTYSLVRLGYDICISENPKEWYKIYEE